MIFLLWVTLVSQLDVHKDALDRCEPITSEPYPQCDWDMNDYCCPIDPIYCNPVCMREMEGE